MAKRPKAVHQLTAHQFEAMFPHEDACKAYLQARRWPEGVRCPRCGNAAVYDLPSRKLSAMQIYRYMGFGSYKTAWEMCHKIRVALIEDIEKLGGIVEVDETWIGGKDHNRHWDKKSGGRGGKGSGKTAIIGAVQRKGNVVARVLQHVTREAAQAFVREAVSHRVSLLATDESSVYHSLTGYPHKAVDHQSGRYVIGAVHTNTIEGFWSIFKRGVVGTFHKMSAKYMPLYVAEFQFRYNNRENVDIFGAAIAGC